MRAGSMIGNERGVFDAADLAAPGVEDLEPDEFGAEKHFFGNHRGPSISSFKADTGHTSILLQLAPSKAHLRSRDLPARATPSSTWPTRKPMTVVLPPLYCSTCLGLAAITSSMIFSSAPVSLICFRPSRSMMAAGAVAGREHLREDVLGEFAGELAFADQRDQFAQVLRRSRATRR